MFFPTFVLISIDGKHDGLQKRINFSHGNETTQMCNVPRLRLQKEEQVAIFLCLVVVGEKALLQLSGFVEVVGDLVLLRA